MHIGLFAPKLQNLSPVSDRTHPIGSEASLFVQLAQYMHNRSHQVSCVLQDPLPSDSEIAAFDWQTDIRPETPFDVGVLLNAADQVRHLAAKFPDLPLVLWVTDELESEALKPLHTPEVQAALEVCVCINPRQRQEFAAHFGFPSDKLRLLRSALSPVFDVIFKDAHTLMYQKPRNLCMVCFSPSEAHIEWLWKEHAERVARFPRMQTFVVRELGAPEVPAFFKTQPGFQILPPLPEPHLAQLLSRCHLALFPEPMAPHTLRLLQAMASGCETLAMDSLYLQGLGPKNTVWPLDPQAFLEALDSALDLWAKDPLAFAKSAFAWVYYANHHHMWVSKSWEFDSLLYQACHSPVAHEF